MNKFSTLDEVNTFYESIVIAGRISGDCLEFGAAGVYTRTSKRLSHNIIRKYVHHVALLRKLQQIELAPGLEASHLCHNKACIKPEHMTAEPHLINMSRNACASVRKTRGISNFCFGHQSYPQCM